MLCALGIPQLERLEQLLAARERVAGWYEERLGAPRRDAAPPPRATGTAGRPTSSRSSAATRRSPALRAQGIEAQIGTYDVSDLTAYRDRGSFPGAREAFARALALPFATTMTEDEVERVAAALTPFA